jgi:hypothetical protein
MGEEIVQEPLFELPPDEDNPDVVINGYKYTYVRGYWRRSPMKKEKADG